MLPPRSPAAAPVASSVPPAISARLFCPPPRKISPLRVPMVRARTVPL